MNKLFSFLLFISATCFCLGQRPMSIDKIMLKTDSLMNESEVLYNFISNEEYTKNKAEKLLQNKTRDTDILTYQKGDTINTLIITDDIYCIYQVSSYQLLDGEVSELTERRMLDSNEIGLIKRKRKCLSHIESNNLIKELDSEYYYSFSLIERSSNQFDIYAIVLTKLENFLPLDTSYLFEFDKDMTLILKTIFPHKVKKMKLENGIEMLILNYDRKIPYILPVDVCRFNLYRFQSDLSELTVFSQLNKRFYTYNAKNKKLTIK